MIASFSRNFIFIKTRKTAGTSIEILLSRFCGPDDIVTPITPNDEMLRAAAGGALAQNYSENPSLESAYREAVLLGDLARALKTRSHASEGARFFNHISAAQVRDTLPAAFWGPAFKFTIERHPYEKVVSRTYWNMARQKNPLSFDAALDNTVRAGDYDDSRLYTENGRVIVDKIFRHEDLPGITAEMCRMIGVDDGIALARAKGNHRKDHRPARDILSESQKRIVRDRAAFSFDVLGYTP